MAVYDIVEGTTAALAFQFFEDGVIVDLTSITVALLLEDRTGTAISSPGTITVTDATNGKVSLAPTSTTTFVATLGPYQARWKLTNSLGAISYIPSTNRDLWNIVGV